LLRQADQRRRDRPLSGDAAGWKAASRRIGGTVAQVRDRPKRLQIALRTGAPMAREASEYRRFGGSGLPMKQEERPLLSVGFILTNSFTLTAFATFVDALRLAADEGDGSRQIRCRWSIMSARPDPVMASCGVGVARSESFQDPRGFDYIVVVGGLLHVGPQLDEKTVAYLRAAAACGVTLIGVCTGSFVLSRIGLMEKRRCCVSWYHYRDFVEEFPDVEPIADQLYVVDRNRITCSGGAGVTDLAAFLIERHLGRAAAQKTLHIMLVDEARPASQSQPQPPTGTEIADQRVRRALILMEQHLGAPLAIGEIARRLNVGTRQFERLFRLSTGMSPVAFYRFLRLRYGLWLLRNTDRSVTAIAIETGFADGAHFSRQFRERYGVPPSKARRSPADGKPDSAAFCDPIADAMGHIGADAVPPVHRLAE
jgi:transcriptional regulator GlxA family with amidase domain